MRRAFFERQTIHPVELCKGYWGFGNRLPANGDFTSTKWSSRNGRHQKWAFGVDETLICNLHLGSAGRLRPLCRASQNGKVKVVRDFCESVVVFESEFPIMPSGSSVPKQFGSGTIWSFNWWDSAACPKVREGCHFRSLQGAWKVNALKNIGFYDAKWCIYFQMLDQLCFSPHHLLLVQFCLWQGDRDLDLKAHILISWKCQFCLDEMLILNGRLLRRNVLPEREGSKKSIWSRRNAHL